MTEKAQKIRTCSICKRDIPEEYFYTKKSYIYKYCIGCARKKSSDNHKKNKKAKEAKTKKKRQVSGK